MGGVDGGIASTGPVHRPIRSILFGPPEAALGFRPDGTWLRYPDPRSIRFKNRLFDDLLADPAKIYPTIGIMAAAGERFLAPAYSDTAADALFKLAYYTGWDLYTSGFRDYNAALNRVPTADDPFTSAVAELWQDAGRTFDYYSNEKPWDWSKTREMVRSAAAPLDPELQRILAQAVLDLFDARQWHRLAFRRVDLHAVLELWNVRDWAATQSDGAEYFPQVEQIADQLDTAALVTSSRKTVFAAGRQAVALRRWERNAPAGRIVVGGAGPDIHQERDVLLSVDLGGNYNYEEAVGASASPTLPVSVALDLSGSDLYQSPDDMTLTQGSGFFGTGVLADLAGDDEYLSGDWSAGCGYWYGMGFLYDKAGNDSYRATVFSLAAGGHFCVGALMDEAGHDVYEGVSDSHTGMGFGHAINSSQVFFVDGGGNDTYVLDAGKNGFGLTGYDAAAWPPTLEANDQAASTQIGLFLDLGGTDRYLERDPTTGAETPSARFYDGLTWYRPETQPAGGAAGAGKHFGIFRDVAGAAADDSTAALNWFRARTRP
jgi:hypothetical protein